jgi:hypothetical protein
MEINKMCLLHPFILREKIIFRYLYLLDITHIKPAAWYIFVAETPSFPFTCVPPFRPRRTDGLSWIRRNTRSWSSKGCFRRTIISTTAPCLLTSSGLCDLLITHISHLAAQDIFEGSRSRSAGRPSGGSSYSSNGSSPCALAYGR